MNKNPRFFQIIVRLMKRVIICATLIALFVARMHSTVVMERNEPYVPVVLALCIGSLFASCVLISYRAYLAAICPCPFGLHGVTKRQNRHAVPTVPIRSIVLDSSVSDSSVSDDPTPPRTCSTSVPETSTRIRSAACAGDSIERDAPCSNSPTRTPLTSAVSPPSPSAKPASRPLRPTLKNSYSATTVPVPVPGDRTRAAYTAAPRRARI